MQDKKRHLLRDMIAQALQEGCRACGGLQLAADNLPVAFVPVGGARVRKIVLYVDAVAGLGFHQKKIGTPNLFPCAHAYVLVPELLREQGRLRAQADNGRLFCRACTGGIGQHRQYLSGAGGQKGLFVVGPVGRIPCQKGVRARGDKEQTPGIAAERPHFVQHLCHGLSASFGIGIFGAEGDKAQGVPAFPDKIVQAVVAAGAQAGKVQQFQPRLFLYAQLFPQPCGIMDDGGRGRRPVARVAFLQKGVHDRVEAGLNIFAGNVVPDAALPAAARRCGDFQTDVFVMDNTHKARAFLLHAGGEQLLAAEKIQERAFAAGSGSGDGDTNPGRLQPPVQMLAGLHDGGERVERESRLFQFPPAPFRFFHQEIQRVSCRIQQIFQGHDGILRYRPEGKRVLRRGWPACRAAGRVAWRRERSP